MIVHFSIMPVGDTSHLSEPIAKAVKLIHDSGLEYKLTPMGTLINGEWKEVMALIRKCHQAVMEDHDRVLTQIKLDDNKGGKVEFADRIKSVEEKAGIEFKNKLNISNTDP